MFQDILEIFPVQPSCISKANYKTQRCAKAGNISKYSSCFLFTRVTWPLSDPSSLYDIADVVLHERIHTLWNSKSLNSRKKKRKKEKKWISHSWRSQDIEYYKIKETPVRNESLCLQTVREKSTQTARLSQHGGAVSAFLELPLKSTVKRCF